MSFIPIHPRLLGSSIMHELDSTHQTILDNEQNVPIAYSPLRGLQHSVNRVILTTKYRSILLHIYIYIIYSFKEKSLM